MFHNPRPQCALCLQENPFSAPPVPCRHMARPQSPAFYAQPLRDFNPLPAPRTQGTKRKFGF
jgi:hypothetical protein